MCKICQTDRPPVKIDMIKIKESFDIASTLSEYIEELPCYSCVRTAKEAVLSRKVISTDAWILNSLYRSRILHKLKTMYTPAKIKNIINPGSSRISDQKYRSKNIIRLNVARNVEKVINSKTEKITYRANPVGKQSKSFVDLEDAIEYVGQRPIAKGNSNVIKKRIEPNIYSNYNEGTKNTYYQVKIYMDGKAYSKNTDTIDKAKIILKEFHEKRTN